MDWKALGESLAKVGLPLLGAALPLPGGAAIGAALAAQLGTDPAKPEDLLAAITGNADASLKAKQFEETHQETLLKITTDAEIRAVEAVNKTMQTEAASDHWPTYSWRPFVGFMFGAYIGSWWLMPLLKIGQPVAMPSELVVACGSILGITAWFRGQMQANPTIKTDNRG